MDAIFRKNDIANKTADKFSLYMSLATIASIILTILFILYFPAYIIAPITELTRKINEISVKKYDQRIETQSNDELSELASAFNKMAFKLKEYESQHFDELLLEKRKMETLVIYLEDGTLLLDEEFKILHANNKFCELINMSLTELLGKRISDLGGGNKISDEIHSIDLNKVRNLSEEKIKAFQVIINGQSEYFQILLLDIRKETKLEIKNEPSGYILLIQNITRYEERDLAKTNLIATISHELKTPLSSINLTVKLLEDERIGSLNKDQKELIESVKMQANRILNLVNEVLDFAQAETGHIKLNIQPYKVNEIIELGTFAILTLLNEKHIKLELSIPEDLPKVKCDVEKTVWVIVNLLTNALRYSSTGDKIIIQVKKEENFAFISILDEGPGITKEEQKVIFEKYIRSKSDSATGTGLGLAIAKEFVEVQGGEIGVDSTPGSGSKFFFSLPTI